MSTAPTLRPYQGAGLEAISTARGNGTNRVLIKMPTGTGKTVMFAELLKWPSLRAWLATLPGKGARMLVIAHREELLTQAAEKISRANPGLMVAIEQSDAVASKYADVVVASIQTLSWGKFRRLERLMQHHSFTVVVVDEAHHAAASTYRTALAYLGFLPKEELVVDGPLNIEAAKFDDVAKMELALRDWDKQAPQDRLLVGVTATPNRTDAVGLACTFQTIAYSYDLKQAIEDGWLVPITPWAVDTSTTLDDVKITAGDFNQRQLADSVNNPARNKLCVKAWLEHAPGLSTLAFTVDVQHAKDLADEFMAAGILAKALSGETPREERRQILADYSAGKIEVVTNCMVLTEGTDLPRTGCILHAKPTKSATLYEQMTGRGLRLFPKKTECIVIDLVDVSRRHSLQTAPVLYGLPPNLAVKGKQLQQVEEDLEALLEKYPGFDVDGKGRKTLDQLRLLAETFDIWSVPELGAFGAGRAMTWIKVGEDEYRLQYPWADGNETLLVRKDLLGHFEVSCTLRPKPVPDEKNPSLIHYGTVRQRTLAAGVLTADAAAGLAEAFVLQERRSVMKLKATDAPWREAPASQKQIDTLRRMRVPFKPGITKGGASDLLDLAFARKGKQLGRR